MKKKCLIKISIALLSGLIMIGFYYAGYNQGFDDCAIIFINK